MAPERVRAICPVAIPHLRLLERSLALLWGGRHFITLRLPSGPWLARRSDFAYLDALMRRWAPNWSGPPARPRWLMSATLRPAGAGGRDQLLPRRLAGDGLGASRCRACGGGHDDIVPAERFSRSDEFFDVPAQRSSPTALAIGRIASAPSSSRSACSYSLPAARLTSSASVSTAATQTLAAMRKR